MTTAMKFHEAELSIPTLLSGNHLVMRGDNLESMRLIDFENAWAGHQCEFMGREIPSGWSGCGEFGGLMEQLGVPYSCTCLAMSVGLSTDSQTLTSPVRNPGRNFERGEMCIRPTRIVGQLGIISYGNSVMSVHTCTLLNNVIKMVLFPR